PTVIPPTVSPLSPYTTLFRSVNALEGYEKYYFLGGSATWGNIRGLFTHNIPGLHVFEEGDYDAPQADGWGVSDVVLLEKADASLDRKSTRLNSSHDQISYAVF